MIRTGADGAPLSPDEVQHYREHGWVVARDFLRRHMGWGDAGGLIEHYMALHEEIPHSERFGGVDDEHDDPNRRYPRLINMKDDRTAALSSAPQLLEAVATLLEDEPSLYQTMLYFKPPQGRGQALHQDMAIITIDPLLGVWIPLESAPTDVGPMMVVDRSHLDGFAAKRDTDMSQSFTTGEAIPQPGRETLSLEMQQGDALFFDGRTIHGSEKNTTDAQWRRTFICHFIGKNAQKLQPPETTTYIHPTAKREDQELEERQHYYREWNAALAKSGGRFAPAGDGPRL